MRRATIRAVAAAGVAALALAGCSSTGDEAGAEGASPSASATPQAQCKADGTLKLGTILPQTGSLAVLGPPEFAGVDVAVQQINDAGGVLGKKVEKFEGDSGDTSTNIAVTTADEQIQRGVDVVVGAASSSVTKTIIDKLTSSGVLQISPANTSTELTDYPDQGLYFRTAPSDLFQGAVLAETAAADSKSRPAVMALQDSYGTSLAESFQRNFTDAGGSLALDPVIYDPNASSFEAEVTKVKAANPDAVVLIGFAESTKVLQELIKQGIGPDKVSLYLVDGNLSNTLGDGLPAGILAGTKGTLPGAKVDPKFRAAMLEQDPKLKDFSYGPEAYDATVVVALAAEAAQSDCGVEIAKQMVAVSSGGQKCTDFASCSKLLAEGKDIDFDGQAGPIEFDDLGNPSKATMGVYQYGEDNTYAPLTYTAGDVPQPAAS